MRGYRLQRQFQELFQVRHKRVLITLEDITTLDHSAHMIDRLLPGGPVVFRFLTLNGYIRVVSWNKVVYATSNGFSILVNSFSRSRLEATFQEKIT